MAHLLIPSKRNQNQEMKTPKFITMEANRVPTDKYIEYANGQRKIMQDGQLRDVKVNESVRYGDLMLAVPEFRLYSLK